MFKQFGIMAVIALVINALILAGAVWLVVTILKAMNVL